MNRKLVRQLNQQITDALLSRKLFPSRKAAAQLLTPEWSEQLADMLPLRQRLHCEDILQLCGPAMRQLSPEEPEKGWGSFCYRYVCNLLFPREKFLAKAGLYADAARFYLTVLQVLLDYERTVLPFDPQFDFQFLAADEASGFETAREYRRLMTAWHKEYVYELMRLGTEYTPFGTLGHIAGVHYVAIQTARGLRRAGVDVDLALLSAAAATHDVGKFGCRPGERVPYLHYYYSDKWLSSRKMDTISHIASNHSTWDLELESLSVESLLLIYADFRSKQGRDEQGREINMIYPLDRSFQVILSKLDNVDEHKRRRYEFVYGKLHDFEDYMRRLGVDTELTGQPPAPVPPKDPSLMTPEETVAGISLLSVEHNIQLMHMLSSEQKFGNIIESARSAKSSAHLLAYLDVFGEYFTHLSVSQKTQALAFLYELLTHRDGAIRRQAGSLMGRIIAKFHLVYKKELPDDVDFDPAAEMPFTMWSEYLEKIIFPDHKTTPQQRSHIGYTLKLMLGSLLEHAQPQDVPRFLDILLQHYSTPASYASDTAFTLLEAIRYLPAQYYDLQTRQMLVSFAVYFVRSGEPRLVTAALEFLREAQRTMPLGDPLNGRIVQTVAPLNDEALTTAFLKYKILQGAGFDAPELERRIYNPDITSEVFLDNLKIATPWIVKVSGVELLRDQVEHGATPHVLHIATHFSNLVKVSERVVVRQTAGRALIHTLPLLRRHQRNEVVVELGKGLEMGQFEISTYIPQYLGEAVLYLHPSELDEQVLWLKSLLGSPNDSAAAGALNTIAVILQNYPAYRERFEEDEHTFESRRQTLLGLMLQGMAHHRESVRQEALLATGNLLFESNKLSMEEKARLFSLAYRKLLYLIRMTPRHDALTFFYRAAVLADVYRFISLYRLDHGPFTFEQPKKIAFFPGTFDPFTLSHKGIVHAIRDMGFEVYLAVDEFSWSKKAQPHLIRRQIVNMSVAGDFHVHLFPDDIPVNIANPSDLKRLQELFPDQQLYIVVGSDVMDNASCYKAAPAPYSIHGMNHVIFRRAGERRDVLDLPISGDVIHLQLPSHLEDISSTRIRENLDQNRDISNFIDPVIQDFIYQNGLYLRDSQTMSVLYSGDLSFRWVDQPSPQLIAQLTSTLEQKEQVCSAAVRKQDRVLLLHRTDGDKVLGFALYRFLPASQLFEALEDHTLADRIRLRAAGNVLLITALYASESQHRRNYGQFLLSELLARALEEEYVYAVFRPHDRRMPAHRDKLFALQGFTAHEGSEPIREVDMRAPIVLLQNLETTIQEPLCRNPRVLEAIARNHQNLQRALTGLYPGSLVLTLSSNIIHHRLLEKITAYNNVPSTPVQPRMLGDSMCVPFGKLLRGKVVPNTVTKTIHTDKVYSPDLRESTLEAFPNYAPLSSQVRTIKSFNRPVILVDDLMHPGFRLNILNPILEQEQVDVRMVVVGILSSYGKDLMKSWNRPVDSVYFLPRLRLWFIESTLYPFIGGNTVRRPAPPVPGLLPGINHILPYSSPHYLEECGPEATFQLSRVCLESALDVLSTLEREYRALYGRNLTLSRLPEAVVLPLCPDKGTCLHYDPNLSASDYLRNDLEQLQRTYHQTGKSL